MKLVERRLLSKGGILVILQEKTKRGRIVAHCLVKGGRPANEDPFRTMPAPEPDVELSVRFWEILPNTWWNRILVRFFPHRYCLEPSS